MRVKLSRRLRVDQLFGLDRTIDIGGDVAKFSVYNPSSEKPFRISRSGIERFVRCPRCFVLKMKHGLKDLPQVPFTLNVAVDDLLKKEFDAYRSSGTVPPVVAQAGLNLIPFAHENMDIWRNAFKGVSHNTHGFHVHGGVDDIWVNDGGELIVVDYKATSRKDPVTQLGEGGFYDGYRRQMEIYQWLLRKNGFTVSPVGYWLYVTATKKEDRFDGVLKFEQNLVSYEGDDSWIEPMLSTIKQALDSDQIPESSGDCETCLYVSARNAIG